MSADSAPTQSLFQTARRLTYLSAAVTFLIVFAIAWSAGSYLDDQGRAMRRLQAQLLVQGHAQRVQDRIQSAVTAAYILGAAVKQGGGRVERFEELAADIMASFPVVSAVELAPGGTIGAIYPLAGNEAAMGHNLLTDRNRNREAHAAIVTRQLTMAGPFDLLQGGGMATVARLPVFLGTGAQARFWGFAIILVRIPHLLDTSGMSELARSGFHYEFWRLLPDSEERSVFARHGAAPPDPAEYSITVPNGRWTLSLAPEAGWRDPAADLRLAGIALLVAACLAGLHMVALQSFLRAIVRIRSGEAARPR